MTVTVTYDYDSFRSDLRKKMHRLGNFQKSSKGGEGVSFSIQKLIQIHDTYFGNFKQGFLSIK